MDDNDSIKVKMKPCPICQIPMRLRRTWSYATRIDDQWFFLFCRDCGYGPAQAYDSTAQAAHQWNEECLYA